MNPHNQMIEILLNGKPFKAGLLKLSVSGNVFCVTGWSNYINIENLTKRIALVELFEIKRMFSEMVESSFELRGFLVGKEIEFRLYFDDSGKVSISICSERNGVARWDMDFK